MIASPAIELTTERLVLKLGDPSEAASVAGYQSRNRAHFARWEPIRSDAFYTASFWQSQLVEDIKAARLDRRYRLFLRERDRPDRVIGQVHFANVVRGAFQACHLGFGIDATLEGRGLMTEALERAIGYAFDELRLHRIEANHRPENERSGRLLKRLGFVPQGYARDYLRIEGEWRDHVLTALTHPAWPTD